eukprot:944736-Prymnesium_polylepis.1
MSSACSTSLLGTGASTWPLPTFFWRDPSRTPKNTYQRALLAEPRTMSVLRFLQTCREATCWIQELRLASSRRLGRTATEHALISSDNQ